MNVGKTSSGRSNTTGWISANKLIDDKCWTYNDRYGHYHGMPPAYKFHNECHRLLKHTTSTAFVIRLSEDQVWTDDVILSIRAIVAELGWKQGFDVFILQHIESFKDYNFLSVPAEFRPFAYQFTNTEIMKDYNAEVFLPIKNPPLEIPLIAQYNHMVETYFMRSRPEYKFGWFAEVDLRSMGRWDIYLDKVEESIKHTTPKGSTMDLVNFGPSYLATSDWAWGKSLAQFNAEDYTMALLQLHRISRALVKEMHEAHKRGKNAYFEGFPTTVTTTSGLNRFTFTNPVFSNGTIPFTGDPFTGIANVDIAGPRLQKTNLYIGNLEDFPKGSPRLLYHGATYCPLGKFSKPYYSEWIANGTICRPSSIVHPVK